MSRRRRNRSNWKKGVEAGSSDGESENLRSVSRRRRRGNWKKGVVFSANNKTPRRRRAEETAGDEENHDAEQEEKEEEAGSSDGGGGGCNDDDDDDIHAVVRPGAVRIGGTAAAAVEGEGAEEEGESNNSSNSNSHNATTPAATATTTTTTTTSSLQQPLPTINATVVDEEEQERILRERIFADVALAQQVQIVHGGGGGEGGEGGLVRRLRGRNRAIVTLATTVSLLLAVGITIGITVGKRKPSVQKQQQQQPATTTGTARVGSGGRNTATPTTLAPTVSPSPTAPPTYAPTPAPTPLCFLDVDVTCTVSGRGRPWLDACRCGPECDRLINDTYYNYPLPNNEGCEYPPFYVEFLYNGGVCNQTFFGIPEEEINFACRDGDVTLYNDGQVAFLIVSDANDPRIVYFNDTIEVGGVFEVYAHVSELGSFGDRTNFTLYDNNDNVNDDRVLIQTVEFDTSCKVPIYVNDRFGSFQLTKYTNSKQGENAGFVPNIADHMRDMRVTFSVTAKSLPPSFSTIHFHHFFVISSFGEFNLTDQTEIGLRDENGGVNNITLVPAVIDMFSVETYEFLYEATGILADGTECRTVDFYEVTMGLNMSDLQR